MAITTRIGKGSELTYTEMDDNLKQIPNGADSSITDTGTNVGIGTSSPNHPLTVSNVSNNSGIRADGGSGQNNTALMLTNSSVNKGFRLNYNVTGDALIVNNTTGDGTYGGSEFMRILSSGGITFNGDTAAANALDDYEEGTWTPTLYGGGNTASSYTQQEGRYVKIGSMVTVYFNLKVSDFGSVSSGLFVSGLPYTPTQYSPYPQGVLDVLNSAINLDDGQCIQISTNKLTLLENLGKTGAHTNINRNDIDVGTTMRGQIQYFTH